jgi:NAD(P)-dependent dehydrogenase (short-subunit alcohol dehydrogenase family)
MAAARTDLKGRVALVTGAGKGIGAESSRLLAQRGAAVAVIDIDPQAASSVADAIVAAGGSALAIEADVSINDQVDKAVAATANAFGQIDILFNNAAALNLARGDRQAAQIDDQNWRDTLNVNLTGLMLFTRAVLLKMIPRKTGSIINCSSISSLGGEFGLTAYSASKAAINQFTRSVATQYGRSGIRCNGIAPGLIQSGSGRVSPERLEMYQRHHATPYLGEPADIAEAVAFLASDASRFITGHILVVDGGATAHASWSAEEFSAAI